MKFKKPERSGSGEKRERKPEELIPEGNNKAICYGLYNIGTQKASSDKYPDKLPCQMLRLMFEFPDILMEVKIPETEETKMLPRVKSKLYKSISFFENAWLRKDMAAWFPELKRQQFEDYDIDMEMVIGKPCRVKVEHFQGERGLVEALGAISEPFPEQKDWKPSMETVIWSFDTCTKLPEAGFGKTPDWVIKEIQKAEEYAEWANANDDLGF